MAARSLRERVTGYRDSLRSQAVQLDEVARLVTTLDHLADVVGLTDASRLFRIVANDLDTLLDGQELRAFRIEGELPPHEPSAEDRGRRG